MSTPTGCLRNGKPTGCLSDEGMEINVESWTGTEWIHQGTKFVDITDEVRAKLEAGAKPQVMSMSAVTAKTAEAAEDDLLASIGLSSKVEDPARVVAYAGEPVALRVNDMPILGSAFDAPGTVVPVVQAPPSFTEVMKELIAPAEEPKLEASGFNVNYYSIEVKNPKRSEKAPYVFEVEDIIQAANLTFHEGNVLKSLIRSVNERNHGPQKAGSDYVRDAEKMEHSSREELRRRRLAAKEGKK